MKFKNIQKGILYAFLLSLLIHVGFLLVSSFIKFFNSPAPIQPRARAMQVMITKVKTPGSGTFKGVQEELEDPSRIDPLLKSVKSVEDAKDRKNIIEDRISSAVDQRREQAVSSVVENPVESIAPQVKDTMVSQSVIRATRKNLVEVGKVSTTDLEVGMPVAVSGKDISKDFLSKNNTSAPTMSAPMRYSSAPDGFETMQKTSSGLQRRIKTADLGSSLTYELFAYQDPKTQEKYFKLSVRVLDLTANLPVIPKEVVILLDSSNSIGNLRLAQFKQGVEYILKNLNPEDRFNIVVFKDKTIPLGPESLTKDPANIEKAVKFLKDFNPGAMTDVYSAIHETLNLEKSLKPSYRIFLSDGFATEGVTNSRQVINQVSEANNGRIGIFAFSGGTSISRYMLDFIAYKNRGWSQYTGRDFLIGKELGKMYDTIRDPLLLNPRYRTSGVNDREVFPKVLPDFFKGSEFVVYGTFKDEDKLALRFLGDVMGEVKEVNVRASLKEAAPGDKTIAYQWAFHKVYHLIGELRHNDKNEGLLKSIDELCTRFGIETPYSKNFR